MESMLRYAVAVLFLATSAGCTSTFLLMDTTSDTVYEYQNDYYVSKIDSTVEFHYELWSQNAELWLSVLNSSDNLLFMILDSTYIVYDGDIYPFNFLVDWDEYSRPLGQIPNLTDYDFNKVMPILPGQWKGMLGQRIPMSVKEWTERDATDVYTRENSPWKIEVQVCFYVEGNAFTPLCKRDVIWVETFTPVDGNTIRSLEIDSDYKKADKFYITNSLGWDG